MRFAHDGDNINSIAGNRSSEGQDLHFACAVVNFQVRNKYNDRPSESLMAG